MVTEPGYIVQTLFGFRTYDPASMERALNHCASIYAKSQRFCFSLDVYLHSSSEINIRMRLLKCIFEPGWMDDAGFECRRGCRRPPYARGRRISLYVFVNCC